jgi:putative dimethyl sulfoxide reductase chaperone
MSAEMIAPEEMAELAQARSRVYGFLGGVFNRLPDDQFAASLSSPELATFLSILGEGEDASEDMQEGLRLMKAFTGASNGKPVEELKTDLAVERTRLLRGIKPGYGPPPPYESVYVEPKQPRLTQAMLSVRDAYAEAGVGLPEDVQDQPDFIGIELDFMRHLTEKESHAWDKSDQSEAKEVLEKEQRFLETHILQWIPRYCDAMLRDAQFDFYRGIARLTKGFVQGEIHTAAELTKAACDVLTD